MTQQEQILANLEANVVDPALIATFYGPRGKLQPLVTLLANALGLTPKSPDNWQNVNRQVYLRRFNPIAVADTTVVQLALNASGSVSAAWATMCWRLGKIFSDDSDLGAVWGYTLIYQAVLSPSISLDDPALGELISKGQRLHAEKESPSTFLAQADVPGGRLWLTAIPRQRDGLQAAMIYVALGPAESQRELVRTVLLDSDAKLLVPDLIAHKGYEKIRKYQNDNMKKRYEHLIDTLGHTTNELLTERKYQQTISKLHKLTWDYNKLRVVVPQLNEQRFLLKWELLSYEQSYVQVDGRQLLEFHHRQLTSVFQELERLVANGQDTLAGESTVYAQLNMAQAQRQYAVQTGLAIMAVALAASQLVQQNVADRLLVLATLPRPEGGYDVLLLLAVQTGVTVTVAFLVWLLAYIWNSLR